MVNHQKIRNHFKSIGMPVHEINKIMNDHILLEQTQYFSKQWGLENISRDLNFNGVGFAG